MKRFLLYATRWQMSTVILAPVMMWMTGQNPWVAAAVANLLGAAVFFWVDKIIFNRGE